MGAGVFSIPAGIELPENLKDCQEVEKVVQFLYPLYYINAPLTEVEKEILSSTWKLIINNNSKEFERMKKLDPKAAYANSLTEYFASRFYSRFVEVHPISAPMFSKSSSKQGRLFMNMITLVVTAEIDGDDEKMIGSLTALVKCHNPMGVRSVEYSIFGECLFWTLKTVLGIENYDTTTNRAWIKFYSKMLSIILPLAIEYELKHPDSLEKFRYRRLRSNSLVDPNPDHDLLENAVKSAAARCCQRRLPGRHHHQQQNNNDTDTYNSTYQQQDETVTQDTFCH